MLFIAAGLGLALVVGGIITLAALYVDEPTASPLADTRSDPDDPNTTGETRARAIANDLAQKGCAQLLRPTVHQSKHQVGVSSSGTGGYTCDTYVAVSAFEDVKLTLSVERPDGKMMRAPPPSNEVIFKACRKSVGQYWIRVESSTADHYTFVQLMCPSVGM
ncbi:MAG: hypothetical protein ACOC1F_14805 [Myxococcota bacterium]